MRGYEVSVNNNKVRFRPKRLRDSLPEKFHKKYDEFSISGDEIIRNLFDHGVIQDCYSNGDQIGGKYVVQFFANQESSQGMYYYPGVPKFLDNELKKAMRWSEVRKSLIINGLALMGFGLGLRTLALNNPGLIPVSDGFITMGAFTGVLSELEKELKSKRFGGREFKEYREELEEKSSNLLYWRLSPFSQMNFWSDVKKLSISGEEFSPHY